MPHPQVELRLELPQADTTIRTDASRLKQVVNNLINNAAKFTGKGQHYVRVPHGRRCGRGRTCSSGIRGKAFRKEHLSRIFERFYKADSYVKGVGLGLSICRTITELLGGEISVVSAPGEGTRL